MNMGFDDELTEMLTDVNKCDSPQAMSACEVKQSPPKVIQELTSYSGTNTKPNPVNTVIDHNQVVIKKYMQIIEVRTYPNGEEYLTSRIWQQGKSNAKKVKKGPKKQIEETVAKEVEEY